MEIWEWKQEYLEHLGKTVSWFSLLCSFTCKKQDIDLQSPSLFRYLAPEYAQSGQITEKADVYSLGVVLVELITGRKAMDLNRPRGQQCLTEWVWI